jgi:hypothetical protein
VGYANGPPRAPATGLSGQCPSARTSLERLGTDLAARQSGLLPVCSQSNSQTALQKSADIIRNRQGQKPRHLQRTCALRECHRHAQTLQDHRRSLPQPPPPFRLALLPHRRHLQQGAPGRMIVMQEVYCKTLHMNRSREMPSAGDGKRRLIRHGMFLNSFRR